MRGGRTVRRGRGRERQGRARGTREEEQKGRDLGLGPSGPAALHIAILLARGPSTLASPEIPPGARCC